MINMILTTIKVKLKILKNKLLLKKNYKVWIKKNKPTPPPHLVKQNNIKDIKNKYNVNILVETGTYLGDMVFAQKNIFQYIYSIEIQPDLYALAVKRFAKQNNISILLGDSGKVLHKLVPQINEKAIFWLDGHYSGGITGRSELNSPIFSELEAIFQSKIEHIVLIDDANCFIGKSGYPSMEELTRFIKSHRKDSFVRVKDNIIFIEFTI